MAEREKHPSAEPQGGAPAKKPRPQPSLSPIAEDADADAAAAAADVVAEAEPKAPRPSDEGRRGHVVINFGVDEPSGADLSLTRQCWEVPIELIERLCPTTTTAYLDHGEAPKIGRVAEAEEGTPAAEQVKHILDTLSPTALASVVGTYVWDDRDDFEVKLEELGIDALLCLLAKMRISDEASVTDASTFREMYIETYE